MRQPQPSPWPPEFAFLLFLVVLLGAATAVYGACLLTDSASCAIAAF